jgi:hypothetical protein
MPFWRGVQDNHRSELPAGTPELSPGRSPGLGRGEMPSPVGTAEIRSQPLQPERWFLLSFFTLHGSHRGAHFAQARTCGSGHPPR